MAPRLKVFTWSDGFHAYTVATASRPKALAAWGVEQNLFQSGLAHELTSGEDHDAALAAPGEVIRRGEAVDKGQLSRAMPPKRGPTQAKKARVCRLEAELEALDLARQKEEAALERERRALETKAEARASAYKRSRDAVRKRLEAARAALQT